MVFVTRFGRCFTGISLRHRVVCNIGLCLKNFIVPVYPCYRVRLHLPNRIEMVIAVSVDKDRSACCVCNLIAVRRGCPAEEFVACGFGEADIVIRSYGCGRVSRVALTAIIIGTRVGAALEIIMIRNRLGLGLLGVDCRQRGVLCDGNLIARVDELAFHFPSAEVFAVYRSKDTRTAAREVFLLVFGRFIRTFFFVCYGIAFTGRSKERIKCYRTVQRCVQIEQHTAFAGYNEPCGRCFAGFCLNTCNDRVKTFGLGDFLTIRNRECFRLAIRRSTQINCCADLRRLPFCVERNALCRHRLAGEHERLAFAKLVIIPACKCVTRIYFTRVIWNIVCVSNAGFVLKVLSIIRTAVVNECDVIRVTGVVEPCTIIIIPNFLTYIFIKSKACDRILVFYCDGQPSIRFHSIFMI